MGKVRVAIIGVGNCASSFVQGLHYYRNAKDGDFVPGLMHVNLGGYHIRDVEISAAIDIDKNKVGKDLSEAIVTWPNNTLVFAELQRDLEPGTWARVALIAVLALVGSFLVSYTRARAEGLGIPCSVGWFERPERLVLLIAAGAFGVGRVMPAALLLLTLLSFATAAQRVAHVWKATRSAAPDGHR